MSDHGPDDGPDDEVVVVTRDGTPLTARRPWELVDEAERGDDVARITARPAPRVTGEPCGRRWVAEIERCPRCGLDAAAHAAAHRGGE